MSPGSMSLVHWSLLKLQRTDRARACARVVLHTPGTSSISKCHCERRQTSESRSTSVFPRIVLPRVASSSSSFNATGGVCPPGFIYFHDIPAIAFASIAVSLNVGFFRVNRRGGAPGARPGFRRSPGGYLKNRDVYFSAAKIDRFVFPIYKNIDLAAFYFTADIADSVLARPWASTGDLDKSSEGKHRRIGCDRLSCNW